MGTHMSVIPRHVQQSGWAAKARRMDVKSKLAEDVKKITAAAAKLKVNAKRKDKIHSEKAAFAKVNVAKEVEKEVYKTSEESVKEDVNEKPRPASQLPSKGLPHHIVAATKVERKWTVTDLLQNLGTFVQKHCTHLHTIPSATEIVIWVRCADRALQLNGWTINSFLMESHVVFTYMLLSRAFQHFVPRTLTDVKELVLMCLYISYTYNANEISYPLRPFLVKQDKVAFWDRCTTLSLSSSTHMLRLNRDHTYYVDVLASLKSITSL